MHLAIIPDGNRRWAKKQLLKPWEGHESGSRAAREIVRWANAHPEVGFLTLWGFSTENWTRDEAEVSKLLKYFETWLKSEKDELVAEKIKVLHSGRRDRLPESLLKLIDAVCAETAGFDGLTLHFALDYGGQDELIRAFKRTKDREVTIETFRQYLDQPELPDIDLLIRTSGEKRISNFMLWQLAYAELYFFEKHFPELKPADLDQAIEEYSQRQRRFGA